MRRISGCYRGSITLATIPEISKITGIHIMQQTLSEAQAGKGACDRMAALVKRHIRIFINENNPCRTPVEFLSAANSHGGIRGITAITGTFENAIQTGKNIQKGSKRPTIPGIIIYAHNIAICKVSHDQSQ